MYEEEAEEYVPNINWHAYSSKEIREEMMVCYRKGAEKANEWHYVKNGDLPKDDIKLAIIEIDDYGYLLCNYHNGFWYDANSGATCAEWITNNIIAWKEIVLPEEEVENESHT